MLRTPQSESPPEVNRRGRDLVGVDGAPELDGMSVVLRGRSALTLARMS
jgi:hypothetical protein